MQALSVLLLVVAGSLSKAQLILNNRSHSTGDQPFNVTVNATATTEMLTVLKSTSLLPKPLTTPKPKDIVERSVSLLHVEPLGMDTCGFFTLPRDVIGMTRTRVCDNASASCAPFGSFLGCDIKAHTVCLNGKEPACAPTARIGDQTLCCPKTRNLNGECQTFIRDDGALGEKTLLGCRETGIAWDPIVFLKTATEDFSTTSTVVVTSAGPVSSTPPEDALAPSTPTLPAASTAPPTTKPSTNESDYTHPHTGVIIGGVLGGLAILGTVACVTVWLVVQRRQASASSCGTDDGVSPLASHELPGDQPYVPRKMAAEEAFGHKPLSPVRTSCEIHQVPAYDAVGSPVKPAELD
ncbi:hypothetical protein LZ30DRAFT_809426 [Colletotrichum cereale]|nr:hypothetical protein LZ30DRAFT_809426 [Colletotrichum cereale]